ncbi:hypothetical protein SAMN05660420_03369 [Desulfuromusa kysingii]|uniref:Uncharacterized protein n=1 Tax=Desulfuromusa kysingii TaxID=37625 RepID=A0A1H4EH67_9BACT|nr:hypothetical protein [Desulfuromusa kysingii]SEA83930.1 hypothetical protein SAMN05660420_03369 [Desulfuromusa kysingii]
MGCHLHNLIDAVRQKELMCADSISDDEFFEMVRVFNNIAPQSICFDMGDIDKFPDIAPVYELVKEPFPDCWFELNFTNIDGGQVVLGMLVVVRDQAQIIVFRKIRKQWMLRGAIFADTLSSWQRYEIIPTSDIFAEELREYKIALSTFLSALNCNNVERVEHTPETKLQKARQKKEKQPLFSHWTLELSIPRSSQENQILNGIHARPRVHLRRGHPRQYKPGKWTWVQPCVVGTGKGIVTKDYAANFVSTEK